MFVADPDLAVPPDHDSVWRYMSFAKFAAILERRQLLFTRADLMPDTFEMAVPDGDMRAIVEMVRRGMDDHAGLPRPAAVEYVARFDQLPKRLVEELDDDQLAWRVLQFFGRFLYLNCWHVNPSESAAMWDLYLGNRGEGVAVRTSVGRLRATFDRPAVDPLVFLGAVEYLDYRTESWGRSRPFSQAFHKRRSFEHERELRAVIIWPTYGDLERKAVDPATHELPSSIAIPADLGDLIEAVVVNPWAQPWFVDLVTTMTARRGLTCDVIASDLYGSPWGGV